MSAEKLQQMQRKAMKIGLENTARILCDEMDAAKVHLRTKEYVYQRSLQAGPSLEWTWRDYLIADQADEDVMEEESEHSNAEDDENETFDMDEDGYVI